ncbi:MAG: Flp pilus assembly complex ATPase component TadA, partial [Deltaproteobacteria bacterium]|nr:Flp pilus assembly complex ATPase component TadA [Deltaproteobacteria bacterium]
MTDRPAARVVAVGGARDGLGKTVFAVNAALCILKETRSRVLLLDLDMDGCGDAAAVLGMEPPRTVAQLLPYLPGLTTEAMSRQVGVHASGLGFLPLGNDPDTARTVDGPTLDRVLDLVLPLCDYVVADCGADVSPVAIRCMERAAGLLFVATPEVLVLRHTRRLVDRLLALQFPTRLVQIVLNRTDVPSAIPLEIVTRTLQRPVLVSLPCEDAEVQPSVQQGRPFAIEQPRARITRAYDAFVRRLVESGLLDTSEEDTRPRGLEVAPGRVRGHAPQPPRVRRSRAHPQRSRRRDRPDSDPRTTLKKALHARLVERLDLKGLQRDPTEEQEEALRRQVRDAVVRLMDEEGSGVTDRHERERIVQEVLDEALGLGPLEDLLADDEITEIMVNGRDQVYVEIKGRIVPAKARFTDDAQLLAVIERIVQPIGRRIDEKSPMVDARLPDGSRVNAVIPPLAIDGPSLTIRKFSRDPLEVEDLVRFGSLTSEMADLLRACVEARLNIVISGGTGSG